MEFCGSAIYHAAGVCVCSRLTCLDTRCMTTLGQHVGQSRVDPASSDSPCECRLIHSGSKRSLSVLTTA
jgi:hypothetical protein